MHIFKWLFGDSTRHRPDDVEPDYETEYLTRAEAETLAATEATRDLQTTPELITYVTYHEPFADYCRVEIVFSEPDQGEYGIRLLPMVERLEAEMIDDSKIKEFAKQGSLLNAVRMYKNLHSVGLAAARAAVEKMLEHD